MSRRSVSCRSVSLGLIAGLIGLHTYGLADALALGSKPALTFWFALALIGTQINAVQEKRKT